MAAQDATSGTQAPPLRTRILQNTLILMAGRGMGMALGVATSILLARHLGAELLGQFGAVYAYVALFSWFATLSIEPVLVREASVNRANASGILATGAALCGIFSIGAAVIAVLLAPYVGYGGKMRILVFFAAIDVLALVPPRLAGVIFQVDLKQWYGVTVSVSRQFLWLVAVVALSLTNAPLLYFIVGRLLTGVFEIALLLVYSAKFLPSPRRILTHQVLPFLRSTIPLALSSLLASVYLRIDQVMLHNLSSDKVLGLYVAAVRVSELFELIPSSLLSSLAPALAVANREEERFHSLVDRIFRYMMILSGGLAVFISVGAPLIIRLLYGAEFAYSAHLLSILIWSEIAIFFAAVVANVLVSGNLQRYLVYPAAFGAVLNVSLNYAFIPRYGAAAAAWATLVSYTLAWMIFLLLFQRTRSIMWRGLRLAIPIVGISLGISLAAKAMPFSAWVKIGPAVFLYAACLWAMRFISFEDLDYVRSAIFRRQRGASVS
jgi:O-antigen/teichoic acid export membrane protein